MLLYDVQVLVVLEHRKRADGADRMQWQRGLTVDLLTSLLEFQILFNGSHDEQNDDQNGKEIYEIDNEECTEEEYH